MRKIGPSCKSRNNILWNLVFLILHLFLVSPVACLAQQDAVESYYQENGHRILKEYAKLLALPNVSRNVDDLRLNAQWIRDAFRQRKVNVELLELEGAAPIIYGTLGALKAKRTLGIYVHYDGQPVDTTQWKHSPWHPVLYTKSMDEGGQQRPFPEQGEKIDPEWRIYGRSVADDKAPIISILAALDIIHARELDLNANLTFFLEGEEESGSRNLGAFIDTYKDKLDVDIWLIFDGPFHQSRRPQLVFGCRGSTGMELTIYGANRYLHSGHYGGWAPNPAMRLAKLLASMKDEDGRVVIEGFYDTIESIELSVKEAAKSIPEFEKALRKELGLAATESNNAPYVDQLLLPALVIRGMESARVGALARNVIPPTAVASLNVRLVKGNDPKQMLDLIEAHIRKQDYYITYDEPTDEERLKYDKIVKVRRRGGMLGFRTSMDLPIVQWVKRIAMNVAGDELIMMPTMGSTLPLYLFEEKLGKPIVITPIANYDNNQHAPNENLRLGNLEYGIKLMTQLFSEAMDVDQ